jgi:hypothetical protein
MFDEMLKFRCDVCLQEIVYLKNSKEYLTNYRYFSVSYIKYNAKFFEVCYECSKTKSLYDLYKAVRERKI